MADYDERTALVVVDVQNDFAHPEGSLYVAGAAGAIARTNEEIARALEGGALVAYSQDWHPEHTPHFAQDGGVWPVHGVAGSWGAELHAALAIAEGAPRVRKGADGSDGYSAFSQRDPQSGEQEATELEALLRESRRRARRDHRAGDGLLRQGDGAGRAAASASPTTVIADAISAVNLEPGDGERALAAIREAGATIE